MFWLEVKLICRGKGTKGDVRKRPEFRPDKGPVLVVYHRKQDGIRLENQATWDYHTPATIFPRGRIRCVSGFLTLCIYSWFLFSMEGQIPLGGFKIHSDERKTLKVHGDDMHKAEVEENHGEGRDRRTFETKSHLARILVPKIWKRKTLYEF